MSRVREFENLRLLNYDPKKVKASDEVKLEMGRLRQQPCLSTVKNLCNVNAQLKIAYINAQSLHRHKMDVEHDFNLSNADVLFCSETGFQESDAKLLTEMSGMHSFRNDAVKRGTQRPPYGIAVYYKPHLIQQLPTIANMNGVEILVCPIKRGCDNNIKVMAVYKPPAAPLQCLLNSLYSAVRNHCGDGQLIIMGYFNVDIYGSSSVYKQLKQFMSDMGLKQHIEEMTTDMRTAINHIYSNVKSIMCGVSEVYYSFHKSIWIALMWIIKDSTLWVLWAQRIALWKALLWIVKVDTARVLWVQRSASRKASLWIVKVDIAWVPWAQRSASRKASLWVVKVYIAWVLWVQRSASRKASLWIVKVDIAWVL